MSKIVDTIKANKKPLVKKALILGAVVATVLVVGALYKANASDGVDLELFEVVPTE